MRIAALILGIIGGIAGLIGAVSAFALGGLASAMGGAAGPSGTEVVGLAGTAFVASLVGLVGASLALAKPKAAGILMLLAAVAGTIGISFAYAIAAPLLFVGGLLALFARRPSVEARRLSTTP